MFGASSRRGGLWMFLFGCLFVVFALAQIARTYASSLGAQTAEGVVIELVERENNDRNGYVYAPRVRFSVEAAGQELEFVSKVGANPPAYAEGERASVL